MTDEPDRLGRAPLVPLPAQPDDVPWPHDHWPEGDLPGGLSRRVDALVDGLFGDTAAHGATYALLLVHRGQLVREVYRGALTHRDGSVESVTEHTRLRSWSVAKSILHALVGTLVGEGRLSLHDRAPIDEWSGRDDPRRAITLEHLLTMRDGLRWSEVYDASNPSDVVEMLFGSARDDVAAYAIDRPLEHEPGTCFNYSSGTSNVVSAVVRRTVEPAETYAAFARRVLDAMGLRGARPVFDAAGTFVASSYVFATARDFARLGLLYLRDGIRDGQRVLPVGWVDHARRIRSRDPTEDRYYGAHWWATPDDHGTFWASGYAGQSVLVSPGLDLVAVRLGESEQSQSHALASWRAALVDAFASG